MAKPPLVSGLYTLKDAAEMLRVSPTTLRGEVRAGRVRYILIGKRKKFTVEDLQAFIEKQRVDPAQFKRSSRPAVAAEKVYDITTKLAERANRKRR